MAPYEMMVDEARHTVRVVLHGFWNLAIARAYLLDLRAVTKRVSQDGARSWWLIDLTDATVQPREVAELFDRQLRGVFPAGATMAVVTGGSVQALQSKRVGADEHLHFTSGAAAEAWLDAQGRPA